MEYIRGLKQNIALAKYTTYNIGGPADYFMIVKNPDDIKKAIRFADDNLLAVFLLAGGSNVLFSDEGFRGLVIKFDNKEIKFGGNRITAGAGIAMGDLVGRSVEKGMKGLEWAGGLPGTLGGAVRGNAGCFGGEIKDSALEVSAMTKGGEIKNYNNADCRFGYRDSVFKRNGEIILSAVLKFSPGNSEELKKEVFEHIKYRQMKHRLPSCGSVFKNCPIEDLPEKVVEKFKDKIKTDPFPIMPIAVLIAAAGLAGKTIGGAQITEEHANIIINFNNAKAGDILALINLVKEKVKEKFGVELNEEVQLAGF